MKMPVTIVGSPLMTSSASRIVAASFRGANSLTKIATITPIGTANIVAISDQDEAADDRGQDPALGCRSPSTTAWS